MIEPAGTSWPSPTFTPRRWPTLSRPFLELEPAFLWAISGYSSFFVRLRFGAADVSSVAAFLARPLGAAFAAPADALPRFGASAASDFPALAFGSGFDSFASFAASAA